MKRLLLCLAVMFLFPVSSFAGGLESFLSQLNIEARADLPGFSAKISTQFGVPIPKVQAVIGSVQQPADAFMVFQLGQMAAQKPDTVLSVYKTNKKKGWGAMAKELGIKPGSPEFHALKNGELVFNGQPAGAYQGPGKGKGKGNGKGNGKGKGHGRWSDE
ncbi:MAG TPA: hypothetical protein VJ550_11615 [Geomonas sp.]|nr:hypothetical protein [Geomonas sp.]